MKEILEPREPISTPTGYIESLILDVIVAGI